MDEIIGNVVNYYMSKLSDKNVLRVRICTAILSVVGLTILCVSTLSKDLNIGLFTTAFCVLIVGFYIELFVSRHD